MKSKIAALDHLFTPDALESYSTDSEGNAEFTTIFPNQSAKQVSVEFKGSIPRQQQQDTVNFNLQ